MSLVATLTELQIAAAAAPAKEIPGLVPVANDQDAEHAAEVLRGVERALSEMEEERTKLKKPILEAGRAVDAFFKKMAVPFEAFKIRQRNVIAIHLDKRRNEVRAAESAAQAAREQQMREDAQRQASISQGTLPAFQPTQFALPSIQPYVAPQGVSVQYTYSAVVKDLAAFVNWCQLTNQLFYLIPDDKKLNALARSFKDELSPIPGVAFEKEASVRVLK